MPLRIRTDVWSISLATEAAATTEAWHPVLDTYARGVTLMRDLDAELSPESWLWAANTHGVPFGTPLRPTWSTCEHASIFFLPWHRAYLTWFEDTIRALTGEPDWALPYWDYSDPDDATTRDLPPEFLVPERTVDGVLEANPLFDPSRSTFPLPAEDVDIVRALSERSFVRPFPRAGFGGVDLDGRFGLVESLPHNFIHVDLAGLMESPATAGRDPIFWLHHCNIDRLWEIWRFLPGSLPLDVQSGIPAGVLMDWRSAQFTFGGLDGPVYDVAQCEQPDLPPLEYSYDTLELPPVLDAAIADARAVQPGGPMGLGEEPLPEVWEPVGASGATRSGETVAVELERPMGLDEVSPDAGLIIELAGCRAVRPHAVYEVEVAVPGGAWHRAGHFATFGLAGTPDAEERSFLVDVSEAVPALIEDGWTRGDLQVRAVPAPDRPDAADAGRELVIGQIVVFAQRT
ncbi:MAG: tyrosinase family protein [Micropruina sp.]